MNGHKNGSSEQSGAASEQSGWHRVHPLTPALRSWQVFVVLIVFVAQDLGENLLSGRGAPSDLPLLRGRVLAGGGLVALVILGVVVLAAYLSWRFTLWRVTTDALELRQGVLSRRQRRAPLDRLQAVDVVQPLLARIVGLARLTLEVAGGGDSRIQLAYLTEKQAHQLRNHLLASAAGIRYVDAEPPEAPESLVFSLPTQRLVGSLALSGSAVSLAVGLVGLATVSVLGRPGVALAAVPALIGVGSVLWRRFSTGFGFRVATAQDGFRLRRGLLEQRTQTVPPGRVQAIRLRQPLLWRLTGWWLVDVNVAGYGPSLGDEQQARVGGLLPVGTRDEAVAVLWFVLPDLGVPGEPAGAVVNAGLMGTGRSGGFTPAPRRARWVDPVGWRREGFRVTSTALLLRRGVFHRQLDVVPHARTQSCGVWQGPVQRRLRVASFLLHSTPGPVTPVVAHLASDVAVALLQAQVARARQARATAGPERWMERPASAPGALQEPAEPAE